MTTGKCRRCKNEFDTTELSMLPVGESYVRTMALNTLMKKEAPDIPDDPICTKHGYDLTDVFCPHCLRELLSEEKEGGS